MIKNAITYNVEMPSLEQLVGLINNGFHSVKPVQGQVSTIGFTTHPIAKTLVSEFEGGYCLTVKKWEKKVDNGAINAQIDELESELEDRKFTKKEKQQLKEQLISEQIKHVLPTPKVTFVYYHFATQTLIIDTVSQSVGDEITALLRKTIGSLKATTLYVDSRIGLTQQVSKCLRVNDRHLLPNTTVDASIELKGGDTNGSLKFDNVDLFDETTSEEIVAQINEGGMYVKSILLSDVAYKCDYSLVDGSKLKSINFSFVNDDGDEDAQHTWRTDSFYCTSVISTIMCEIVNHFTVVED